MAGLHSFLLISAVILISNCNSGMCRPDGAPLNACHEMIPHHYTSDQEGPAPFDYILEKTSLGAGETTKITLKTKTGGPSYFRGFLVMAGNWNSSHMDPVGTFKTEKGVPVKTSNCLDKTNSAVTHSDPTEKTSISFEWTAPQQTGNYTVVVSLVQEKEICWSQDSRMKVEVTSKSGLKPVQSIWWILLSIIIGHKIAN